MENRKPVAQKRGVVKVVVAESDDGVVFRELRSRRCASAAVDDGTGVESVDSREGPRALQRRLNVGKPGCFVCSDDEDLGAVCERTGRAEVSGGICGGGCRCAFDQRRHNTGTSGLLKVPSRLFLFPVSSYLYLPSLLMMLRLTYCMLIILPKRHKFNPYQF